MSVGVIKGNLSAWYEDEEPFETGQDAAPRWIVPGSVEYLSLKAGRKEEDDAGGSSTQDDELNSEVDYDDPYVSEDDELSARIDERMEKFYRRKMELLFELEFKEQFSSLDDFLTREPRLWIGDHPWFFNAKQDGDIDEYGRFCLMKVGPLDLDYSPYHDIGSSVESDLEYPAFMCLVYEEIRKIKLTGTGFSFAFWYDGYEECLVKAKKIRDTFMPAIDENLLDTCVRECKAWLILKGPHEELLELLVEIMRSIPSPRESNEFPADSRKRKNMEDSDSERALFSKVLIDITTTEKRDSFPILMDQLQHHLDPMDEPGSLWVTFNDFRNYLKSQKLYKGEELSEAKANLQYLASQYLKKFLADDMTPSNYVYYVMKKMQYASKLGLLEEHVRDLMCENVKMLESKLALS